MNSIHQKNAYRWPLSAQCKKYETRTALWISEPQRASRLASLSWREWRGNGTRVDSVSWGHTWKIYLWSSAVGDKYAEDGYTPVTPLTELFACCVWRWFLFLQKRSLWASLLSVRTLEQKWMQFLFTMVWCSNMKRSTLPASSRCEKIRTFSSVFRKLSLSWVVLIVLSCRLTCLASFKESIFLDLTAIREWLFTLYVHSLF